MEELSCPASASGEALLQIDYKALLEDEGVVDQESASEQ